MVTRATLHEVVVGVDGSRDADGAIRWAEQYCDRTGSTMQIVVAWQWPMSFGYPIAYDGYSPERDAQQVAEKAAAGLTLPADQVRVVVTEGMAGLCLVEAAATAELLVVGSHGHGVVPRVLLGSVSTYCVHHATVPVVVVR